jgi:hypothetical protein
VKKSLWRLRLVAALLALGELVSTGCQTYCATRSRVVSTKKVQEAGALLSSQPVSSTVTGVSLVFAGFEPERVEAIGPCLLVDARAHVEHSYDAALVEREVVTRRYAYASRAFKMWLSQGLFDAMGTDDTLVFLVAFTACTPLLLCLMVDAVTPLYGKIAAYSHAGTALDGGGTPAGSGLTPDERVVVVVQEPDVYCAVKLVDRQEVGEAVATGQTTRVVRAEDRPLADTEVRLALRWTDRRGEHTKTATARTDAAGRARFPLRGLPMDDAPSRLALHLEAKDAPPVDVPVPANLAAEIERVRANDVARLERWRAADGPLVESARAAGSRGDAAGIARSLGTLLASDPSAEGRLCLAEALPSVLRAAGTIPVPEESVHAVENAAAACAAHDTESARRHAEAAVAFAPWWSEGHRVLAAAHALAGDRPAAARALVNALALTPGGTERADELRLLLARWMLGRESGS